MVLGYETSKLIRSWQEDMCNQFKVCKSLTSPPHITVVPPFRTTSSFAIDIKAMIKSFENDLHITTNHMSHFDDRVIYVDVMPSQELTNKRNDLITQIRDMGIDIRVRKQYRPHITIGHKIPKRTFPLAWNHFKDYQMEEAVQLTGPVLFIHQDGMWKVVE